MINDEQARALFDTALRHQIYYESLKQYQQDLLTTELIAVQRELRSILLSLSVDSLADLPKHRLRSLLSRMIRIQTQSLRRYYSALIKFLVAYLDADAGILTRLAEQNSGMPPVGGLPTSSEIWGALSGTAMPANGVTPDALISTFTATAGAALSGLLTRSAANHETTAEALASLVGTRAAGYRDGFIGKITNQGNTATATIMQYVTAYLQDLVYGLFTDRYMWNSVIDSRTTDICRSRNGRVYIKGKGPIPPAHFNCRSTVVPIFIRSPRPALPNSFFAWMQDQPADFQNDVLRRRIADALRRGDLGPDDMPRFSDPRPLTLDDYKGKFNYMLTGTKD